MHKSSPQTEIERQLITWLLEGDVSIQYQVHRDLLAIEKPHLRERIAAEGWGAKFLSFRKKEGHWGRAFYQPKWISTHYTILDLKNLGIFPDIQEIKESLLLILQKHTGVDGGINPSRTIKQSELCISGMFLNYASYFEMRESDLTCIVDFVIGEQMGDGGFNCEVNRGGAIHSSLHTTISVLEGILEYVNNSYSYRTSELKQIAAEAREFILQHKLFRSDHTGEIIDKRMLMLSYPSRWRYDILRALDYFQFAGIDYDPRMQDALDILKNKRRKDNKWPLQARHPGKVHFEMEKSREPSRWNTLRAMRVLKHFGEIIPDL
jgi:hypothetical protein